MTGRAEVARLRQRLDATFERAAQLGAEAEILSDFARYLCVLVSGYLEQAVQELILDFVRKSSSPAVLGHVESDLRRQTNLKAQRLIALFGSFDADWRRDLEAFVVDKRKDALDGIVDLRNSVAHGRPAGVTLVRVRDYYAAIQEVLDHVADLCDPQ